MTKVLIVLSAADHWTRKDGTLYDSGVWAEEFVAIDETLRKAGAEVTLASPDGVAPTIDGKSVDPEVVGEELSERMNAYLAENQARLDAPRKLSEMKGSDFDAVIIPGGHGPVEDLYKDTDMGRVLIEADEAENIVASVCHGPAALMSAKKPDGTWQFAGRKLTAFSDEEEVEFGTADNAPWLLAQSLRELGADYSQGPNWEANIVKDGNLLSGQNPASSQPLADALVEQLNL